MSIAVQFSNPNSGQIKSVKVGWSWTLLLFSGLLGIPLFMRKLHYWGFFFAALALFGSFASGSIARAQTQLAQSNPTTRPEIAPRQANTTRVQADLLERVTTLVAKAEHLYRQDNVPRWDYLSSLNEELANLALVRKEIDASNDAGRVVANKLDSAIGMLREKQTLILQQFRLETMLEQQVRECHYLVKEKGVTDGLMDKKIVFVNHAATQGITLGTFLCSFASGRIFPALRETPPDEVAISFPNVRLTMQRSIIDGAQRIRPDPKGPYAVVRVDTDRGSAHVMSSDQGIEILLRLIQSYGTRVPETSVR